MRRANDDYRWRTKNMVEVGERAFGRCLQTTCTPRVWFCVPPNAEIRASPIHTHFKTPTIFMMESIANCSQSSIICCSDISHPALSGFGCYHCYYSCKFVTLLIITMLCVAVGRQYFDISCANDSAANLSTGFFSLIVWCYTRELPAAMAEERRNIISFNSQFYSISSCSEDLQHVLIA